jgi:hypothetical protein
MISNSLRVASLLLLLTGFSVAACTSGETANTSSGGTPGGGGTPGSGGSATGGTSASGGSATGGTSASGGSATGGTSASGGSATGGTSASGGSATGGKLTTGGSGAGGVATGGKLTTGGGGAGGVGTGGKLTTGGSGAGGVGTGGVGTGGQLATGGSGAGGVGTVATGGSGAGGATGGGGTIVAGGNPENTGAGCGATSAPMLSAKLAKLPDPFAMHSGTRISAKADWECRRNEIKADIEKYEVGPKQEPSTATVAATLSGSTLTVKVTTSSGSLTLTSAVSGSGSCVAIGMNGASGIISGCTQIPFMHDNVIAYAGGTGSQNQSDPFYKVYPSLWGKIGNYSAWAWGISRLIDGIEQVKDQLKVDTTKIGVQGCSYAGKMALFGGAFDERVALTVAEESGGGGITAWRASQDFTTRTGVSVEKIDNTNFAWFMSSMKSLDPYKLPHDHHELIAMVAPRAFIALGNPGYQWLGDESGYKSVMAALEVFTAMGVADHFGYDFTGGHSHCSAPATQVASVKAFVDRYLKGGTTAPNVAIKPTDSTFQLTADFDWTAPTLQ